MKYIDLHVHSLFSGATCTPEELVDKASAQGLVAFALTDHDTVGGVDRALAAAKDKHLQVIPGVELSCEYQITPTRSKEIHILGYNIDWKQKELLDIAEKYDLIVTGGSDFHGLYNAFPIRKCVKICKKPGIRLIMIP